MQSGRDQIRAGPRGQAAVEQAGDGKPVLLLPGVAALARIGGSVHGGLGRSEAVHREMAQRFHQQRIEALGGHRRIGAGTISNVAVVIGRAGKRWRNQPASRCPPAEAA